MRELIGEVLRAIAGRRAAALVTPVATSGSLPTGRHARMLVFAEGASLGTVGGGRLEAAAQQAAQKAIGEGRPRLLQVALTAVDALADGLLCGGQITFFIEPLREAETAPFTALEQLLSNRRPGLEAILLLEGREVRRLVAGVDGTVVGTLGSETLDQAVLAQLGEALAEDRAQLEEMQTDEEQVQVFLQALQPRPTVILFGGGHVGLALTRLVPTVGMGVVVIDDRSEFCNRERFPMAAELYVRDFSAALEGLEIDPLTYLVVMTRGHQADRQVVAQALRTNAGYIGMIGSRRKITLLWESLRKEGFTDADLARVHAPIGLKIGGDSPGEIAISVMAELIMVRHQGRVNRSAVDPSDCP